MRAMAPPGPSAKVDEDTPVRSPMKRSVIAVPVAVLVEPEVDRVVAGLELDFDDPQPLSADATRHAVPTTTPIRASVPATEPPSPGNRFAESSTREFRIHL